MTSLFYIQAKSAGAQIRRHNEQVLMEKINEQIINWGEYLSKCRTIFVRAPKHQKFVMLKPLHEIVQHKTVIRWVIHDDSFIITNNES